MSGETFDFLSPEEYLERDRRDPWKNEYLEGRMTPMPHPAPDHVLIASQLGAELHGQLKHTSFRAAMMRLRLHIFPRQFSTCRVQGDLARSIDKLSTTNGLAVWADGRRSLICADLCTLHRCSSIPGQPLAVAPTI